MYFIVLFRSALAQSVSSPFCVHCAKVPKDGVRVLPPQKIPMTIYLMSNACFSLLCSVSAMVCNICECSLTFLSLPWLPPPPSPALPRNKARGKVFLQQRVETAFRSAQKSCEYLESCMMSHTASVLYQLERIATDNLPWHKSFFWKKTLKPKKMRTKFTCSKVLLLRIHKYSKFLNSILKIPLPKAH